MFVRPRLRLSPTDRAALAELAGEERRLVRDQIEVLIREGLSRWRHRRRMRTWRAGAGGHLALVQAQGDDGEAR